jgi:hypothetical protein
MSLKTKRLSVATIFGLLSGFVCYSLASGSGSLPGPVALQIIAERTLIGFAIGISVLSLGHWSVHGLIMGLIFSIPLALSGLMAPDNPKFSKEMMFFMTVLMGMIYGVLIELLTTVVFKAPAERKAAPSAT